MRKITVFVCLAMLSGTAHAQSSLEAQFDVAPCTVQEASLLSPGEMAKFDGQSSQETIVALTANIQCPKNYWALNATDVGKQHETLRTQLTESMKNAMRYNYDYIMDGSCRVLTFGSSLKGEAKGTHISMMFACPPGHPSGPDTHD